MGRFEGDARDVSRVGLFVFTLIRDQRPRHRCSQPPDRRNVREEEEKRAASLHSNAELWGRDEDEK